MEIIEKVEQLAQIVEKFKLDSIEVEGLKITKSKHTYSEAELKKLWPSQSLPSKPGEIDDETLFWSAKGTP